MYSQDCELGGSGNRGSRQKIINPMRKMTTKQDKPLDSGVYPTFRSTQMEILGIHYGNPFKPVGVGKRVNWAFGHC